MKKRLPSILVGLLFLVGLGIMIYPTVSNQWNTYRQNKLISNYEKIVDDMSLVKNGKMHKHLMKQ